MAEPDTALRYDLAAMADAVTSGARVLDIGCGEGDLMEALEAQKGCDARGIELDPELVERCVARGLSVVQGNADTALREYPDNSFDYTILSQTLPTSMRPDLLLDQLLRVGSRTLVSFPNFAHWRTRTALLLGGRMPITRALPVNWYATQNIHHVTIEDFRDLVKEQGARIERRWFFSDEKQIGAPGANWRAEYAIYELRR
ncbi:MAG: methionine biosynthesis protein MetW [Pseudomonadota bacterium]